MSTSKTSIGWTDITWNPTRGCRRISPGCENCYAERQAYRFSNPTEKVPKPPYQGLVRLGTNGPTWTGKGRLIASVLEEPRGWKQPQRVFVDSMSDLFFEQFTNEEIAAVFGVMANHPHLIFQVLTKRATRMRKWFEWIKHETADVNAMDVGTLIGTCATNYVDADVLERSWPLPNVWLGVSIENQQYADERIPELLRTPAAIRFASYEPALDLVDFANVRVRSYIASDGRAVPVDGATIDAINGVGPLLNWIIVGGESGPKSRPFDLAWARAVIDQCVGSNTCVFIKQMGSNAHDSMRSIVGGWSPGDPEPDIRVRFANRKGEEPSEWEPALRVQDFPSGEVHS